MKVARYLGNPWIGLFLKTSEDIALLPVDSPDKLVDKIKEYLKTDVHKLSIGNSNLLGIYCAMNSHGIVVPNIIYKDEIAALKKIGLNVHCSSARNNAHGNNIVVNDKGGIINSNIDKKERKNMEDALGVELVPMQLAGYTAVGSLCIATNKGYLAHYKTNEEEQKQLEQILKVKGSIGSLNMGTGFIKLGAIANTKGYLAGEISSAFELGRLEEALGFL